MAKIRWTHEERMLVAQKLTTLAHVSSKLEAILAAQTVLPANRQRPFQHSNAAGTISDLLGTYAASQPLPDDSKPKPQDNVLNDISTVINGNLFSANTLIGIVGTISLLGLAACAVAKLSRKELATALNTFADSMEKK